VRGTGIGYAGMKAPKMQREREEALTRPSRQRGAVNGEDGRRTSGCG